VLTYGRSVNASPGDWRPVHRDRKSIARGRRTGLSRPPIGRARPGRRPMSTRNLNHRAAEAGGFFL
jgi:hypothetical protein